MRLKSSPASFCASATCSRVIRSDSRSRSLAAFLSPWEEARFIQAWAFT